MRWSQRERDRLRRALTGCVVVFVIICTAMLPLLFGALRRNSHRSDAFFITLIVMTILDLGGILWLLQFEFPRLMRKALQIEESRK